MEDVEKERKVDAKLILSSEFEEEVKRTAERNQRRTATWSIGAQVQFWRLSTCVIGCEIGPSRRRRRHLPKSFSLVGGGPSLLHFPATKSVLSIFFSLFLSLSLSQSLWWNGTKISTTGPIGFIPPSTNRSRTLDRKESSPNEWTVLTHSVSTPVQKMTLDGSKFVQFFARNNYMKKWILIQCKMHFTS